MDECGVKIPDDALQAFLSDLETCGGTRTETLVTIWTASLREKLGILGGTHEENELRNELIRIATEVFK